MDGIIGLIVFAIISFVYNKLTQNQDAKKEAGADLSEWLEEVEKTPASSPPPPPKVAPVKKKDKIILKNTETPEKSIALENQSSPFPVFKSNIKESSDTYRTVHKESSQDIDSKDFTKARRNKRHSLNYKNKKTLRQAFILNTVLSKAKSYEP